MCVYTRVRVTGSWGVGDLVGDACMLEGVGFLDAKEPPTSLSSDRPAQPWPLTDLCGEVCCPEVVVATLYRHLGQLTGHLVVGGWGGLAGVCATHTAQRSTLRGEHVVGMARW